ncbi:hypothetical protein EJ110_NYTH45633 [Nymphaea thermarum]|nr:hypothetical protein EJ110_NYTH45633 [Nymphaea thermarum]
MYSSNPVMPTVSTANASVPRLTTLPCKSLSGLREDARQGKLQILGSGLALPIRPPLRVQYKVAIPLIQKASSRNVRCSAALNARCATEQQTIQQQSAVITNAPAQGKEKSPELDDGGTGFPPRDDDDGGGGGGGGGGGWTGGFFFFGFLAFLGLLKDQESEGPYSKDRRR